MRALSNKYEGVPDVVDQVTDRSVSFGLAVTSS